MTVIICPQNLDLFNYLLSVAILFQGLAHRNREILDSLQ